MLRRTRRSQRGFTLAEVMMATALIGVLVYATVTISSTGIKLTKSNMDKQFATQKAISMLEEMKALVQVNQGTTITVLDGYDDGTSYRARLTTRGLILTDPPAEPVSGNILLGPTYATQSFTAFTPLPSVGWLYSRQISVRPLTDPNNPLQLIGSTDVRLVRVRVYKNDVSGPRLLAEVASVIRTLAVAFPPTQVYDVYCIAVENIPGWWVNMSSLVPFVQAAINDLQDRHPGLEYRQHWITHAAFGRDTQYKPYINSNVAAAQNAANTPQIVPFVYFYPGKFPDNYMPEAGGAAVGSPAQFYYPPNSMGATMLDDSAGGVLNLQSVNLNPVPYALADMYNHAMRYYQERDLWNQRSVATVPAVAPSVVATLAYPTEADEPTLRLLIDDMYMNPNNYLNALVINLHGELMPFPATRNYSDPAKKPDQYPTNGVRVVTHPETLTTQNGEAISLRVYSYAMKPDVPGPGAVAPAATPIMYTGPAFGGSLPVLPLTQEFLREPITVVIRGVNWDPTAAPICVAPGTATTNMTNCVAALTGGVDLDTTTPATAQSQSGTGVNISPRDPYRPIFPAPTTNAPVAVPPSNRMYYTRSYIGPAAGATTGDTVIKLYNSPLVSPCVPFPSDCTFNQNAASVGSGGIEHVANGNWTKRLYGLEYIPSPMENFAQATAQQPFSRDLDTMGPSTKNTARWVLTIPTAALGNNRVVQVETYLGDYTPTSTALTLGRPVSGTFAPVYSEPTNLSMTFAWHGDNSYVFGNAAAAPPVPPTLPLTERFQMLGDPRHVPYADLKKVHADNGGAWPAGNVNTNLGMGYNRYFDDFEDAFGNEMSAWSVSRPPNNCIPTCPANYNIVAGNRVFAIKIDGTNRNVSLTLGGARTPAQIAGDLNASGAFFGNAFADVFNNRIRVRSRATGPTSLVQFDTTVANNAAATLGYKGEIVYPSWNGWAYNIGGVDYGVKNSNSIAPTAAQQSDDGWVTSNGSFEIDAPRMFQCFRSALMRTSSIYTTMTGYPYYYLGIGNEIGYDGANGWPDNVPVSRRPFEGTDTAQYFEQTITPGKNWGDTVTTWGGGGSSAATNARSGVKYIQESDGSWWGMNWTGELYPDDQYDIGPLSSPPVAATTNDWKGLGNLPTPTPGVTGPTAPNTFRRIRRDLNPLNATALTHLVADDANDRTHTPGTTLEAGARRSHNQGVATFYWAGTASTVNVPAASQQGVLAAGGTEIANNYNFPIDNPIGANRGFVINGNAVAPNDSLLSGVQPMYGAQNTLTDQWSLGLFYNAADGALVPNIRANEWASDLIAMRQGTNAAFVVQNGLSPSGVTGTDFIARWSFLVLTQGFLDAGRFDPGAGIGQAPAVQQLPRVNITSPNVNTNTTNPSTLTVSWALNWLRWDGKGYTSAYPAAYTPPVVPVISYFTTFSSDNGTTWVYLQNPARTAIPGVRLLPIDRLTGLPDPDYATCRLTANTYNWTGIAALPAGAYIIRVEAYRDAFPLHYATHQYQIFINR